MKQSFLKGYSSCENTGTSPYPGTGLLLSRESKITLISSMSLLSGWMWHHIIFAYIFHSHFNTYKHLSTSNKSSRVIQIKENSSTLTAWLRFIWLFQISVPHSKTCNISQVPYNVLLDWPFQGYNVPATHCSGVLLVCIPTTSGIHWKNISWASLSVLYNLDVS